MLPERDKLLVQIVDASLDDATQRARKHDGTSWLACRPSCTPCCHGVFRISQLDAERLRSGLQELEANDGARAAALRERAHVFVNAVKQWYPGNSRTGVLDEEDCAWGEFADKGETDLPCPVLNPETGRCELYASRPLTCRVFGPPVRNEAGIGICELCYIGASEADIRAGEMHLVHQSLEEELGHEIGAGETVIAWALLQQT